MICRVRIRVEPRANPTACPKCLSLDTWRWNREPAFLRPLTAMLDLIRLTPNRPQGWSRVEPPPRHFVGTRAEPFEGLLRD